MINSKIRVLVALALTTASLAACGGGDDTYHDDTYHITHEGNVTHHKPLPVPNEDSSGELPGPVPPDESSNQQCQASLTGQQHGKPNQCL